MVSESDEQALRFGAFELDPGTAELRKDGTRLRLPPQPLRILSLLASRSGQLVTREEIREQIWGSETFVDFEQGLNFAINRIRTVLGDDADNPRFIETLPRRGYRFVAPVERVEATSKDPPIALATVPSGSGGVPRQQAAAPVATALPREPSDFTQRAVSVVVDAVVEAREEVDRWRRLATAGIVALALAVVAGALVGLNVGSVRDRLLDRVGWGPMDSVVVLPFENATGNPEVEYLSDGITENLINALSQIPHLRVVPRIERPLDHYGTRDPKRRLSGNRRGADGRGHGLAGLGRELRAAHVGRDDHRRRHRARYFAEAAAEVDTAEDAAWP